MYNIIPMPKTAELTNEYLIAEPAYTTDCADFKNTLHALSDICDRLWGLSLRHLDVSMVNNSSLMTPLTEKQETENGERKEEKEPPSCVIFVKYDSGMRSGEYAVSTDKFCIVTAGDREGVVNAFATLLQVSERTCDKHIKIPKGEIKDFPDSSWRALLLDVARQWHPVEYLYKYVELCALLKINRFVIHFTDDESFTLPLDCFPNLSTENRTYSKAEIAALGEYAHSLGVMIVPEVDMPGHCAQFILKYPEVFGTYGILEASEEVFSALEAIYAECAEMFPHSDYIHVGGDEAVLGRWDDSQKTKEYMAEHGIEDFVTLHGHFIGRVCRSILALGKTPVAWEGFRRECNHMIPKETLMIAWESHYQLAPELLEGGFTIINASWKPLYVVSPWQKWSRGEILLNWDRFTWDHWWEGSVAFKNKIKVSSDSPVCGAMLCAWGDYLKEYESPRLACQLEFASVMPRLSALSEKTWNGETAYTEDSFSAAYGKFKGNISRLFGTHPFKGEL